MNERVCADYPGAITIAEESTAFPKVSRPVKDGGLGFAFKCNMGWMHDTLGYFRRDPIHRRHHQNDEIGDSGSRYRIAGILKEGVFPERCAAATTRTT